MRTLQARFRTIGLLGLILVGIALLHVLSAPEKGAPASAAAPECSDGIDNDLDGDIDFPEDRTCDGLEDEYEGPTDHGIHLNVTDGKITADAGDQLHYTIRVSNTSTVEKTTDVRFILPEQARLIAGSDAGLVQGNSITWQAVTVYPQQPRTFTVTVQVENNAQLDEQLVAEARAGGARATDTTLITHETTPASNWTQISVTDGKTYASPEEILTYRILVTNRENIEREIDVRTETPAEFVLHEVTGPHRKEGRKIMWDDLEFGPKETREFFVTGHVERDAPEFFSLRLKVSSGQEVATDTTTIRREGTAAAGLVISVNDGQKVATSGQDLQYEVVIHNPSNELVTNLDVNAVLPQYTEFVDALDGGQWTGSSVYWKGLTVSPFGERVLRYAIRVRSDAPIGSAIRAGVVAKGIESFDITQIGASRVGDNRGGVQQPVRSGSALSKVADQREVQPGSTVGFTVTLRNTTDRPWTNITVTDKFDHTLLRVVEQSEGGQLQAGGVITWQIATLAPGQSWNAHYRMQVHPQAPHGLTVSNVVSAVGDGMENLSLTERIITSKVGVVTHLPKSGAALDLFFIVFSSIVGAGQVAAMSLKRKALLA
jgi:uncharacterized repeat protein (TIGR01451 family)